MRQAVLQALDDALAEDATVILLGEDIAEAGGAFKCTDGLLEKYGADRVIDTPISEMGFMGAAVGAAVCGLRPVVEMMFVEFTGVALDALTTQAATMRYLSRGKFTAPLVTAEIARNGRNVTLVAAGAMVKVAREAAEQSKTDIEIIDLLTLWPWDRRTVRDSVKRTGRLVTLEEAPRGTGWGGDVVAAI